MKKIAILIVVLFTALQASAQLVSIEAVQWETTRHTCEGTVFLSNGENLIVARVFEQLKACKENGEKVSTNISPGVSYPKGTLVQKTGCVYTLVRLHKIADKVIKYASTREVSSAFSGEMSGSFSYGSFLAIGGGSGSISGQFSGGTKTVVNVVFTDNSSCSIDVSADPLWLEAQKGMNVEHYRAGTYNVYKLCF